MTMPLVPSIECVDLFCGVGGLTHGLARAGVKVVAGIDLDPDCKVPYEANNDAAFHERDVRDLTGGEVQAMFGAGAVRLLAGCAPCQPFSTYSRKGRRDDGQWDLVRDFGRLVRESQPHLVTMENVPQLVDCPVFAQFLADLAGYQVSWDVVDCVRYGVPQTRKRLVLLASRLGAVSLAPAGRQRKARTVRAAIAKLRPLEAGEADPRDPLHAACRLSDLNLRRIRASKPGGTWRDWDASLRAKCHAKDTGQTYPSVYGRMEWDAPAPTMTTQCFGYGNGRFGHPAQDRAITLREAAILQTFPRRYRFVEKGKPLIFSIMGRLIGNAVPVRIGEVIGRSLVAHVAGAMAERAVPGMGKRA
ncbi:DNA cytosine methyltransferase (plasmid) [Roseomonas sp. OT10]|uniref:DNA cytosine methyltransferase n=1 Tax=Roseomonas cutis TaxID=2897332 RepID=UPI001E2A5E58|nr:DNA cytosine methyltransferase [Roseomonas sp. OT10]UFN51602.1 DNA cytosine methyltransferase [Roseomonas sp. OT10]